MTGRRFCWAAAVVHAALFAFVFATCGAWFAVVGAAAGLAYMPPWHRHPVPFRRAGGPRRGGRRHGGPLGRYPRRWQ